LQRHSTSLRNSEFQLRVYPNVDEHFVNGVTIIAICMIFLIET
jgi:hypothetical protein